MVPCIVSFKKVKAIYFKIKQDQVVYVTCSKQYQNNIESIILSKSKWILHHYRKLSVLIPLKTTTHISYFGNIMAYSIQKKSTGKQCLTVTNNEMTFYIKNPNNAEKGIDLLLKKATNDFIHSIMPEWYKKTGLIPKQISIRKMKKWGSCHKKGLIVFNSYLICLPKSLIEYVLCHELMHLKHFDHSQNFHNAVVGFLPDAKKLEKELKMYVR